MTEVIFEGTKIQVGHRIKIPKAIVDTLNLKQGQSITIKFDANKREFYIKEVKRAKK